MEDSLRQTVRKLEQDVREGNKELDCLYGFADLVDRKDGTLDEILQETVRLLPRAFPYPELACCRVVVGDQEFITGNFRQTPFKLSSAIMDRKDHAGVLEIFCTEEAPDCSESTFLEGKQRLIDMIAGRLGRLVEQRKIEANARRNKRKYSAMLENAVEGMFQTTPDGLLLGTNPAYARMFGYSSPEELTDGSFNVVEHVYANTADRILFKELIETEGVVQSFQFQALRKDRTRIWASLNARTVKDETGKVLYYEGTIEDITLLKQAEQEARDNAERYQRLFHLESDAIFLVDNETGRILEANNAAVSLYGYSREEILAKTIEDISAEPDETRRATQNELNVVPIRYHRKKDGTVFPVEITLTYLLWNGRRSHLAAIRDVTERKRIEDTLRKSEEEYRNIYDNAMVGIFKSTPDGKYLRVNNAMASICGFSSPEEMMTTITSIGEQLYVNPDERQRYTSLLKEVDSIQGFEAQLYRKDRSTVWASMNLKAIRSPDGSVAWYEGILQDISERRQVEAALRESEERYRSLFDHSRDAIFLTMPDGSILDANRAACRMTGWSLGELKRVGRDQVVDRSDTRLDVSLNQRAATGTTRAEITMIRANGERFPAEFTSAVFTDIHGRQKTSMMVRDITDRRRAEEELNRRSMAMAASVDGISIVNTNDELTYVNAAHARMYGYDSPEELLGKNWKVLCNDEQLRRYEEDTLPRFREKGEWSGEATGRRKDGTNFFQDVSLTALDDGGIIAVIRDASEHKKLQSQLHQAQKMESLGTLAGGIAHDFNNILTSLMGYATLIQLRMEKENPLRQYVGQILSASEKAAELVKGLLAFSRKQSVRLVPLSLNEAIKGTQKLLKRLLTEDIGLHTIFTKDETVVMADRSQIDQILFNLTTNGRDAMPRGGAFTIETGIMVIDREFVRVHGFGEPGRYVVISVSDTGAGMDSATLGKIFEPFFTTKSAGKGTGLGLATVYGIVQQHNGHISVYSEPGYGTTFRIYIPSVDGKTNQETDTKGPVFGGKETVLIAEDDGEVRQFMLDALELYGYRIIEAVDGQDAVDKFKLNRDIDIVILDSVMPKRNGREVYDEIRGMRPDIKVLFTSGYTKDVILDKGIIDKEIQFIPKPLSVDKLLEKVRKVLDGR